MFLIFAILTGWITVSSFLLFLLVLRIWWFNIFIYVCVYLFLCIYYLHVSLLFLVPVEIRRGRQNSWYWRDNAKLRCGCWESKLDYLEEQLVSLTAALVWHNWSNGFLPRSALFPCCQVYRQQWRYVFSFSLCCGIPAESQSWILMLYY